MRFYLTGQRTFGNRGCEAIVRSTVGVINDALGPCKFLIPSDNIARDQRQWPDAEAHGVSFVQAYYPFHARLWTHLQRLPLRSLKRASWPFPFPHWLRQQIGTVDAVLAVGGDNYSLDYLLPSLIVAQDRLAMDLGKPVILWGASVGPFEAEPDFVPFIRDHLCRMKIIAVRESMSYEYLTKTLGLNNVVLMADPAFTLSKEPVDAGAFWPRAGNEGVLGLNISPLIERYRQEGQDLRAETIAFIRAAVTKGFGVLLMPHVIAIEGVAKSNDAIYMAAMLAELADLGDSVAIAPTTLNASQIKSVVSRTRFFIGARTHSTVAALSSGVPTISISYSVKAIGINKDLLGDLPVVLRTPDLSAVSLMERLDFLLQSEALVRARLARNVPVWQGRVASAAREIPIMLEPAG